MRRAALVHPHLELGKAPRQRPRGTRMVEVDVGERQRPHGTLAERAEERRQAGGRPGVDEHIAEQPGADHLRAPEVEKVDRLGLGCR